MATLSRLPSSLRELKESMQAGKLDPEVSFLNASLIPDVFPVLVAACKALSPVHSEFVYNYLVSKHITESLKRCGISDDSSYDLMLLVMSCEETYRWKRDWFRRVGRKSRPSSDTKALQNIRPELGISTIADAITCRVAAQDAL